MKYFTLLLLSVALLMFSVGCEPATPEGNGNGDDTTTDVVPEGDVTPEGGDATTDGDEDADPGQASVTPGPAIDPPTIDLDPSVDAPKSGDE